MKYLTAETAILHAEEEIRIGDTVRAFRKWLARRKLTRDGKPLTDAQKRDIGVRIAFSFTSAQRGDCPHCEMHDAVGDLWQQFLDRAQGERLNN